MKVMLTFVLTIVLIPLLIAWFWTSKSSKKDKLSFATRVGIVSCIMICLNTALINTNYRRPIIIKLEEEKLAITKLLPKENFVSDFYGMKTKYFVSEYLPISEYKEEQTLKKK